MGDICTLRLHFADSIKSTGATKVAGLCEAWLHTLVLKSATAAEWSVLIDALVMRDASEPLREVIAHPQAPHALLPLASSERDPPASILHCVIGSSWECLCVVLESLLRKNELPHVCLGYTQRNEQGAVRLATFLLAELALVDMHQVSEICQVVARFRDCKLLPVQPNASDYAFFDSAKDILAEQQLSEVCSVLFTEPPCCPVYVDVSDDDD